MAKKTMTQLKKELTPDQATMVKTLLTMFRKIGLKNPQLIKDNFGHYTASLSEDKQDNMVQFYLDNAEDLIALFDLH